MLRKAFSLSLYCLLLSSCSPPERAAPAFDVLRRTIGDDAAERFELELREDLASTDGYELRSDGKTVRVAGTSQVALARGAYEFLKSDTHGMITWSGNNVRLPEALPETARTGSSPYQYRYYFNVVTHGYTTAYWDWSRWEREIDWMALHGINMPLIGGAHEAILARVFRKIGLTEAESAAYFSGPAYFPWNRMGNLVGWSGPPPAGYFDEQVALNHKILSRMRQLGMRPIIHAFAGFVPKGIERLHPAEDIRELGWGGGLPAHHNAYILSPKSELFVEIGRLYIEEWEKEFGRADFYLADSFNEMDVPLPSDPRAALRELEAYGAAVYRSIHEANPNATWVMQGWTFPYHKDGQGRLFWTPERLNALVSRVPDDKLLILDLANEYNRVFWNIDPSWKMYDGFFGKQWIYSFIPNMGGKTPLNGVLDVYAGIAAEALRYENKRNLVGFGFAPEGIENNEIIYELLSDVAWTDRPIAPDGWIERYCKQRYGAYPNSIERAYRLLRASAYGTFTDHPMHRYQLRPYGKPDAVVEHATVHQSPAFAQAVGAFLEDSEQLKSSAFYVYDAIDLAAQYLGLVVDEKLQAFLAATQEGRAADLTEVSEVLLFMDRLLVSHPHRNLRDWLDFARGWGETEEEKDWYESDARRLITTWGGDPVTDYAGRVWSGLIRDYYLPRWRNYYDEQASDRKTQMRAWEEAWVTASGVTEVVPFADPVAAAKAMVRKHLSNEPPLPSTPANTLTSAEVAEGWELLFDGRTTTGWRGYGKDHMPAAWKVEDGALMLDPSSTNDRGDVVSTGEYTDFDFRIEWKISPKGNSGIFFHVAELPGHHHVSDTGPEMQVLDNEGHEDGASRTHRAGDLYDLIPSRVDAARPAGHWNEARIVLRDGELQYWLNGQEIIATTIHDEQWARRIANSKFAGIEVFGVQKKGRFGLQDHGDKVWYRNIKVLRLED